jgi:acetyl esterase/lipase
MTSTHENKYLIDPELQVSLDLLLASYPGGLNAPETIEERRELISTYLAQFPRNESVSRSDLKIKSKKGDVEIPIRLYRPLNQSTPSRFDCAVFMIHGGGMVMGSLETDDANAAFLSLALDCLVISVDYRLAPEHPFPAGLDDCSDASAWVFANASELKISPKKIVLYGGSAGGGLAISLGMRMREQSENQFALICAPYPMLDDRNQTPATFEITDLGVWDRRANIESWGWYLGQQPASEKDPEFSQVSIYAAPARAEDLSGLAPIYTDIGDADLFRDDVIDFVNRLRDAGNQVEFHLIPGMFHAGELFNPDAAISKALWQRRFDAINGAFSRG